MLAEILFLSLLAGLATGLGGLLGVLRKPGRKLLGLQMGFAGGVMVSLSFLGLLLEAWRAGSPFHATIAFTAGALLGFGIDFSLPHIHFSMKEKGPKLLHPRLLRVGILLAVGIAIHNLPEGIALGAGYLHLPKFGLLVALAIALHNIPEGIASAAPLVAAGWSKARAFALALLSGLAEPLGAVVAVVFLMPFTALIPLALAFAAGIMVFITFDELMPMAHTHLEEHYVSFGLILGCLLTLLLLGVLS